MTSTTIVLICIALLLAIFIVAMIGIFHADKANREALSYERVACAGSVDNSYPAVVRVKLPDDSIKTTGRLAKDEMNALSRFIVKGNSMQYANINPDDLVYVRKVNVDELRNNLPKTTLLQFKPKSPGKADRKIRRTWKVIDSDISEEEFNEVLDSIFVQPQFNELRQTMGDRCPSDTLLKQIAVDRLHQYRQTHMADQKQSSEELLLSTTFRTELNRLEFSIHPASSLQGVVAYVSHRISPSPS